MSWKDKAGQVLHSSSLSGLYQFAGGLSEFWAFVFSVACIILAFKGKLDGNFALAVTAITGILAGHDAMDDYHVRQTQNTTIVNDININGNGKATTASSLPPVPPQV